jgi:hypothetical protein
VNIAIVFTPDPALGPDPNDAAANPRSLGHLIDEHTDALVIWREWGGGFEGGYRDHVVSQGIWEHLTSNQVIGALDAVRGER